MIDIPKWVFALLLCGTVAWIVLVAAKQGVATGLLVAIGLAVPLTGWIIALLSD